MERADIKNKLLDELGAVLGRELRDEDAAKPLRDLGVDSLSMVELFVAVEREFGVKLLEGGYGKADFRSVDALATAIAKPPQ
jgi:acyl carrier protein